MFELIQATPNRVPVTPPPRTAAFYFRESSSRFNDLRELIPGSHLLPSS